MKRFFFFAMLMGGLAWAGSSITTSRSNSLTGTLDNTKTGGIPTVHQNGTNLRAVHITVSNPDDAGGGTITDIDKVWGCRFYAYKYTPQNAATDGGVGLAWSRYMQMDYLGFDAGVQALSKQAGITVSIPLTQPGSVMGESLVPMGNGSRLQWITSDCANTDGGVPIMQDITEGFYK